MKRWSWLLALAIIPLQGAQAQEQARVAPETPALAEVVKKAEEKAAAGDLEGATKILGKEAERSPEAWLYLGRILVSYGELDNGIDALAAASEKLSGAVKAEAYARLALAQEDRGLTEAATASAESAAAADAKGAWPMIALARARAREARAGEAIAFAEQAVAAAPGAAAFAALGYAREAAGELAGAEQAYREAVSKAPDGVASSVGLARVLRKTGRAAEAEPILQQVIERSPGAIVAYKESARVKLALKRPREALGDASIAAALSEGDAEAQKLVHEAGIARGLAYLDQNQVSNAVYELKLYRDEHPDVAEAHLGLGQAYVAQRSLDEALASFGKAVELDPGLAEAYYQIGYVQHMLKKDPSGALLSYEKAVEAATDRLEYRLQLASALSELKQYDRAIEQLEQVVASPAYAGADAWLDLGAAQLAAQRYAEAIPALQKALTVTPDSVQAEAYLAWCYFGTKDSEEFVKHAERARSLGYKDATLDQYLERVKGGEEIR